MKCLLLLMALACAQALATEPLPPMLNLPGTGGDETKIDYAALLVLKGVHAVICPISDDWKFQLHDYLLYHGGKFWCMWSHGPDVEDLPKQHVAYATSDDGLKWSEPKPLSGLPDEGRAYIARDFWVRDGKLLALVASYKGKGAFGVDKDLKLLAFEWDEASSAWQPKGSIFDNAINNFAPQKISSGDWVMTRRDARMNVSMLIGGIKALNDWRMFPVIDRTASARATGFSPDEPVWWERPDKSIVGVFRDNGGSSRLFRAISTDLGQTWTTPEKTNYPNATSKLCPLLTSRGYRVLISNANPTLGRRELHLAVSEDGLTFTRMGRLDIPSPKPATLQYPHLIEHEGNLFITFSRNKNISEIIKVSLDEVDRLRGK